MKIYLIVILFMGPGNGYKEFAYSHNNLDECNKAIEASRTTVATGGDSEGGFSLFCALRKE